MSNTVTTVGDATMVKAYGILSVRSGRELSNAGITLPLRWALTWSSATRRLVAKKMESSKDSSTALILLNSPPDPSMGAPSKIAANTMALAALLQTRYRRVSVMLDVPETAAIWRPFYTATIVEVSKAWARAGPQLGGQLYTPTLDGLNLTKGGPRDMTGYLTENAALFHITQALKAGRRDPRKSRNRGLSPRERRQAAATGHQARSLSSTSGSGLHAPPQQNSTATFSRQTQTEGPTEATLQLAPLVRSAEKAWRSNSDLHRQIGQLTADAETLQPAVIQAINYAMVPQLGILAQRIEVLERRLGPTNDEQYAEPRSEAGSTQDLVCGEGEDSEDAADLEEVSRDLEALVSQQEDQLLQEPLADGEAPQHPPTEYAAEEMELEIIPAEEGTSYAITVDNI
jgi:hypothetical protein